MRSASGQVPLALMISFTYLLSMPCSAFSEDLEMLIQEADAIVRGIIPSQNTQSDLGTPLHSNSPEHTQNLWTIHPLVIFKIDEFWADATIASRTESFLLHTPYLFFLKRAPSTTVHYRVIRAIPEDTSQANPTVEGRSPSPLSSIGPSWRIPWEILGKADGCQIAKTLAHQFPSLPLTQQPRQLVHILETTSKTCGFRWCNPQYCH